MVSKHVPLTCTCPAACPSLSPSVTTDILVDPLFLDAFQQQPSSPTYDKLLAGLPRAFVGTAAELKQLVALLTAQSMKAYADNVSTKGWDHGRGFVSAGVGLGMAGAGGNCAVRALCTGMRA